jgi:DNA-binding LytR/AlgR family response regulator
MKIILIEDEAPAAKQLTKLLTQLDPTIFVLETLDSIEGATTWLRNFPAPDAIFMDIQIADGLSFEIFNRVQITCPVVFTTAFDQYAVKAFRVNAIDYLLKPLEISELAIVLNKLKNKIAPNYSIDLFQTIANQFMKPPTFKTRFLTQFYTFQNKKYLIEQTLDELENQLNPTQYFRINRKMIVAIKCIKKISPYFNSRLKLELNPPYAEDIFVARERVAEFKTWLGG